MNNNLNPSEQFVFNLCKQSFLQLWTHPSPIGKKGKELCDCLIVCGPHIIIISVKEIEYKDTGDITGFERWTKSAIEKSASQIWGAERWLRKVNVVERNDGRKITLPPKSKRKYHRVAVALGGKGQVPIKWGDLGNGFVHVCDEYSVGVIFKALDTITDFVSFLTDSEKLIKSDIGIVFAGGGIEDLIALYLLNNRSFEALFENKKPSMLIIENDLWEGLYNSKEFAAMQKQLKDSYIWDNLIEYYANDLLTDGMFDMHSKEVTDNELALVEMALQPRIVRQSLAESFMEFLLNEELKIASRAVKVNKSTVFVFLIGKSADREQRAKELGLRCFVARGMYPDTKTVVGIATDRPGSSEIGYSSDILYMHIPNWTKENEEHANKIKEELGYFQNPKKSEK